MTDDVKHTPGPWHFDGSKGPALGGGVVRATIGIWAQHRFDLALAQDDDEIEPEDEKWLCGAWGASSPEDFANARLIAASPCLLEALRDALDAWETNNRSGDGMVHKDNTFFTTVYTPDRFFPVPAGNLVCPTVWRLPE